MYQVEVNFLKHNGGTKFYETVMISDHESELRALIKRYGPIGSFGPHRGATLIATRNATRSLATRSLAAEQGAVLYTKRYRRGDKGFYEDADNPSRCLVSGVTAPADLLTMLNWHYKATDAKTLITHFDLLSQDIQPPAKESATEITEAPTPIVRVADWGIW